jgi:uncharacterized membrane-anchored protein
MAEDFRKKVNELSDQLQKAESSLHAEAHPNYLLWAGSALVPIVVGIALYYFQPWFVKVSENGKQVQSTGKIIAWTSVVAIIVWVCIYIYTIMWKQ